MSATNNNIMLRLKFDAHFYLNTYPDAQNILFDHWVTQGLPKEGRRGSPKFDVKFYLNAYPDLQKEFGTDYCAAFDHWLRQGLPKEGRWGSPDFDVKYYLRIKENKDLKAIFKTDYLAAFNHWLTQGLPVEGRKGSPEFDVKNYLNTNDDLQKKFETDYRAAVNYWLIKKLNTEYQEDSPVLNMNPICFTKEGKKKKETFRREFDAQFYLSSYPDLQNALFNHWLTKGLPEEGRRGSSEFDVKFYLNAYPDLQKEFGTDYRAAFDHWLTQGLPKEGRRGSPEFDVRFYLNDNDDLKNIFQTDYLGALGHWIQYGRKEGRRGKEFSDRPLIGLQRWDMFSGRGEYVEDEWGYLPGESEKEFLKPDEWHSRAPFFFRKTNDVNWVQHPYNAGPLWFNYPYKESVLQKTMDQEITFATEAGVDFFIFNGPTRTIYPNGWELHNNLDAYLKNSMPNKVKFVYALYGHEAICYGRSEVDLMLNEVIDYMKRPTWQKIKDDRPLLPVLWPENFEKHLSSQSQASERMSLQEFVEHIRIRVKLAGLKTPYLVAETDNRAYNFVQKYLDAGFDAMTDYQGGYGGSEAQRDEGPTYKNATQSLVQTYDDHFIGKMNFIPPAPIGMYQWPRAKILEGKGEGENKELYHYQNPYLPGDISERIRKVFDYVIARPNECDAQTVFMYSWNEHSEGGALCPTMGASPEYIPATQYLDEFERALTEYEHYLRRP